MSPCKARPENGGRIILKAGAKAVVPERADKYGGALSGVLGAWPNRVGSGRRRARRAGSGQKPDGLRQTRTRDQHM